MGGARMGERGWGSEDGESEDRGARTGRARIGGARRERE